MRVLFSTVSSARYMLPPLLGDEQINCGPEWADDIAPDGRVRSLATPVGDYDLAAVAARLPATQQPDVVVVLADASWRNAPVNLAAFSCPRVLLVADTHHLASPVIGMLRYMATQPFDRAVFLYDRHHVDFFRSAGLGNVSWFPGLTFPHDDATVRAARRSPAARARRVAFVGQTGKIHPRRTALLDALRARGVNVAAQPLPQREALGLYGGSLLGFNASLNGDLNLRVIEIAAAGGALLTDRLAPESGLGELLGGAAGCATYADATELADRAAHLLAHPAEARALGETAARWFDDHLSAARRRDAFRALVTDGTPAFPLPPLGAPLFGGDIDRLLPALMVYEGVQELHRTQDRVRVWLDATVPDDIARLCATLPRVECERDPLAAAGADLAVFSRANAAATAHTDAARLWCWDATPDDIAPLADALAGSGCVPASNDVAVFCRPDPVAVG